MNQTFCEQTGVSYILRLTNRCHKTSNSIIVVIKPHTTLGKDIMTDSGHALVNKLKTTPTPNKNGSYGKKSRGSYGHKSRSLHAIKVGSYTLFSVKVRLFQRIFRHTTPHFMAYFGSIFFANTIGPKMITHTFLLFGN